MTFISHNIGFIIIIITSILFIMRLSVIGMLSRMVGSFEQFRERLIQILESNGGTFHQKSWFASSDTLFTCNPANVHHIMSTNFSNYPKGTYWRERFDIFGDSMFNSDFAEWKHDRALLSKGFFNHQSFHELMPKIFEDSMEKRLIPFLEHVSQQDAPVALHHLLGKPMYYIACRLSFGCDIPILFDDEDLFPKAIGDACEAICFRYFLPECIWKRQKWLRIGKEKRLNEARVNLHHLISKFVRLEKEEHMDFSLLKLLLLRDEQPIKVIKDNMLAFMFAAYDTTSTTLTWFFWLLQKHPSVLNRIRDETQKHFPQNGETKWLPFSATELNKMVYLHAALCETLRLYPPVPSQSRTALQNDTLPSGHKVNQRTSIVISTYAMGRMKSIWGEDCHEFKPERWITSDGLGIKREAAHKFFAFNAGPRSCLGKDVAFTMMKALASAICHNYDVMVVNSDNHQIGSKPSIMLHMNHELMVRVKKRFWV